MLLVSVRLNSQYDRSLTLLDYDLSDSACDVGRTLKESGKTSAAPEVIPTYLPGSPEFSCARCTASTASKRGIDFSRVPLGNSSITVSVRDDGGIDDVISYP